MENIFTGNLISPDTVSIPTVQTPLRPNQPVTYGRGESFSVYVKYPVGTKRLLFTINDRTFTTSPPVFQQIVFPNPKEGGIAEFSVDTATTLKFSAGLYYWDIFQLRDDGSKDIWSPYNTGTFSIVEFPSSNFVEVSNTSTTEDIYNITPPSNSSGRNLRLVATQGQDWSLVVRWTAGSVLADLSGYSAFMPIKTSASATSNLIELRNTNGRISFNVAESTITMSLAASSILSLAPSTYYYFLELSRGSYSTKLIGGDFVVES